MIFAAPEHAIRFIVGITSIAEQPVPVDAESQAPLVVVRVKAADETDNAWQDRGVRTPDEAFDLQHTSERDVGIMVEVTPYLGGDTQALDVSRRQYAHFASTHNDPQPKIFLCGIFTPYVARIGVMNYNRFAVLRRVQISASADFSNSLLYDIYLDWPGVRIPGALPPEFQIRRASTGAGATLYVRVAHSATLQSQTSAENPLGGFPTYVYGVTPEMGAWSAPLTLTWPAVDTDTTISPPYGIADFAADSSGLQASIGLQVIHPGPGDTSGGSGGGVLGKWNSITLPDGDHSLSMGAYRTTWTWGTDTLAASPLFSLQNGNNDVGIGYLMAVTTPGTTNQKHPFGVFANGVNSFIVAKGGGVGVGAAVADIPAGPSLTVHAPFIVGKPAATQLSAFYGDASFYSKIIAEKGAAGRVTVGDGGVDTVLSSTADGDLSSGVLYFRRASAASGSQAQNTRTGAIYFEGKTGAFYTTLGSISLRRIEYLGATYYPGTDLLEFKVAEAQLSLHTYGVYIRNTALDYTEGFADNAGEMWFRGGDKLMRSLAPGSPGQLMRYHATENRPEWVNASIGIFTTGTLSLARGGTGASLTAPAGDRIFFYDQSAASTAWLDLGTGLSITGTTLSASGGTATRWDQIGDPLSTKTLNMSAYFTALQWATTPNFVTMFTFESGIGTANGDTSSGYLVQIQTPGTLSNKDPFRVQGRSWTAIDVKSQGGVGIGTDGTATPAAPGLYVRTSLNVGTSLTSQPSYFYGDSTFYTKAIADKAAAGKAILGEAGVDLALNATVDGDIAGSGIYLRRASSANGSQVVNTQTGGVYFQGKSGGIYTTYGSVTVRREVGYLGDTISTLKLTVASDGGLHVSNSYGVKILAVAQDPAPAAFGDMWYRDLAGYMRVLPVGASGQLLRAAAGGYPEWATVAAGGSPAAPFGSIQYNNAGSFGSVTSSVTATDIIYTGYDTTFRKSSPTIVYVDAAHNSAFGSYIALYKSRGDLNSRLAANVGDTIGAFTFNLFVTGSAIKTGASMSAEATGVVNGIQWPTDLVFRTAFNTDSPRVALRLTYAQYVGIGRDIANANVVWPLTVFSSGNDLAAGAATITVYGSVDKERIELRSVTGSPIYMGKRANGTPGIESVPVNSNILVGLGGSGWDANGWYAPQNGLVGIYAAGTWTTSSHPTYVTVETTASGSLTPSEKVRVDGNGLMTVTGTFRDTIGSPGQVYINEGGTLPSVRVYGYGVTNIPEVGFYKAAAGGGAIGSSDEDLGQLVFYYQLAIPTRAAKIVAKQVLGIYGVEITASSSTPMIGVYDDGLLLKLGGDFLGDLYYRDSTGRLARRPATTNGYVLTLSGGIPVWAAPAGGGGLAMGGSPGQVLFNNGGVIGGISSSVVSGANLTLGGTLTVTTATSDIVLGSGQATVDAKTYSNSGSSYFALWRGGASGASVINNDSLGRFLWLGRVGGFFTQIADISVTYNSAGSLMQVTPHGGGIGTFRINGATDHLGPVTFADDIRVTFNPGTTAAGLNVGSNTVNPSSPQNGDIMYNTTLGTGKFQFYQNSQWLELGGVWNLIGSPTGDQSLAMAGRTSTWTWNAALSGTNAFTLATTGAYSAAGSVLSIQTAGSPFSAVVNSLHTFTMKSDGGIAHTLSNGSSGFGSVFYAHSLSYTDNSTIDVTGGRRALRILYTRTSSAGTAFGGFDALVGLEAIVSDNLPNVLRGLDIKGPVISSGKTLAGWSSIHLRAKTGLGVATNQYGLTTELPLFNGFGTDTPTATFHLSGTAKFDINGSVGGTGDIWYQNASGLMTRLAISPTPGHVLTVAGGLPSWAAVSGGGGGGYATILNEGSPLFARTQMNFIGNVVNAADNGGSVRTDITINAVDQTNGFGTELQYRTGQYTLGGVGSSSVSGPNVTLGGTLTASAGSNGSVRVRDALGQNVNVVLDAMLGQFFGPEIYFYKAGVGGANINSTIDVIGTIWWMAKIGGSYGTAAGISVSYTPTGARMAINANTGTLTLTNTLLWQTGTARFEVGAGAFEVMHSASLTTGLQTVANYYTRTTGVPADGWGARQAFYLKSTSGADQLAAYLDVFWQESTDANRTAVASIATAANASGTPIRRTIWGPRKALVDNTLTDLFSVPFAVLDHKDVGGEFHVKVTAKQTSGGNQIQVFRRTLSFIAAHNGANNTGFAIWGLETNTIGGSTSGTATLRYFVNGVESWTGGPPPTIATYTVNANTYTFQIQVDTGLGTPSELFCEYSIDMDGDLDLTLAP